MNFSKILFSTAADYAQKKTNLPSMEVRPAYHIYEIDPPGMMPLQLIRPAGFQIQLNDLDFLCRRTLYA